MGLITDGAEQAVHRVRHQRFFSKKGRSASAVKDFQAQFIDAAAGVDALYRPRQIGGSHFGIPTSASSQSTCVSLWFRVCIALASSAQDSSRGKWAHR